MRRNETSAAERRKDAREKIILGGLIVKAGLRNAPRDFLMGAFLQISKIQQGSEQFDALQRLGRQELSGPKVPLPPSQSGDNDQQKS